MELPKYLQEESVKRKANKAEATVYRHLCSGALSFKGDFSTEDTCLDLKSTKFKSIRVSSDMCEKLIKDSLMMGKEKSVLILELPNYYLTCNVIKK